MMFVAMVNQSILEPFITDVDRDAEIRMKIYMSWGSFLRAFVSMFEITLANWGPPCWLLMDAVDERWGLFFIFWRCCFGFAVVQVITSVFIQHTFAVASRDEVISVYEFEAALKDPRVRHWFAALELDVSKLPAVFEMLAGEDGCVGKDEFIDGLKQCKGQAQRMDILALRKEVQKLQRRLMQYGALRATDTPEVWNQTWALSDASLSAKAGCALPRPQATAGSQEMLRTEIE